MATLSRDRARAHDYRAHMIGSWLKTLHAHRAAPLVALLVSGGLLVGAWIFQYGFGYVPCQMCYWQRHAHKAVLAVAVLWFILRAFGVKVEAIMKWVVVAAFLVSFYFAAWHMGVEYGIFEAPPTCLAGNLGTLAVDSNDPLAFLDNNIRPPACSEAVWHFLSLSMAGWNALISLISALWIATSKVK
jgi:disulfide bond formation protein DsbB